ncbi:MAG: hypothetical protein M3N39_12850 [Pseudomonadota bacterium]|nr:hypothetical protein [Pseudomonadota bacterium]
MYRHITIGVSAAALAAATASAQSSTDSQMNWQSRNCSTSNWCQIKNGAAFNSTNHENRAQISVSGTGNDAEITQIWNKNSASIFVNGNGNNGWILELGDEHSARLEQNGDGNGAVIDQNDRRNSVTVQQTATANAVGGHTLSGGPKDVNFTKVLQGASGFEQPESARGERNVATSVQNGSALESIIYQYHFANAPADDNEATVMQRGSGSFSVVRQHSRGNKALVHMVEGGTGTSRNASTISQANAGFRGTSTGGFTTGNGLPDESVPFGNPISGNIADVSIAGYQQNSHIIQGGVQNRAIISLSGGGPGNTDKEIAAGRANPATGDALPENRVAGNFVDLRQSGRGVFAEVSTGRDRRISLASTRLNNGAGTGNIAYIDQWQGNAAYAGTTSAIVRRTDPITSREAHRAFVHQRGELDVVNIRQENNTDGTTIQSGSIADVAQMSFASTTSITQFGSNTARVTQGVNRLEVGGSNTTTIKQIDAGDSGTGGNGARNQADVAQYGISNVANVDQNAVNASATIFQKVGSRANLADVDQGTGAALRYFNSASGGSQGIAAGTGTGAAAVNLAASITQSDRGGETSISQDGTNLSAVADQSGTNPAAASNANHILIVQMGSWNGANVLQSGFNQHATIEQQGIGVSTLKHDAKIDQSGDSHSATIRQTATVRPTQSCATTGNCPSAGNANDPAFPNARAAGTLYSAEALIIQRGTLAGGDGNDAAIEQRGNGQFARIDQNGSNNNAGIIQDRGATNAVALITQTGANNDYYIYQSAPGQYLRVVQNGNGNRTTNVVANGGGGASAASMSAAGGTFRGPAPGF